MSSVIVVRLSPRTTRVRASGIELERDASPLTVREAIGDALRIRDLIADAEERVPAKPRRYPHSPAPSRPVTVPLSSAQRRAEWGDLDDDLRIIDQIGQIGGAL